MAKRKKNPDNKATLPQTPKNMKSDGIDVEYSEELADLQDREAVARSEAAEKRAKNKKL
ncbi:YfhD family protein [Caldibacillus lycopersici]|uniref:YfhD family protein n=1 Tax=Perspicuibacillus lycopersici TaxID=1325689 RepID=A0AAE3LP72_9BACI|nr:YfhD family protein [Perspicuibacillus lycopersici]MCU9614637.1 YfhD family protein [Perspicuibacillus lycopersici]